MRRLIAVSALFAFAGCTSGDFKLLNNGASSLTVAKGSSGTRTFTLQAEGHYLRTKFDVTSSASKSGITTSVSPTVIDTGEGGSADVTLQVEVASDFPDTSASASIRVQAQGDPESFASASFTLLTP